MQSGKKEVFLDYLEWGELKVIRIRLFKGKKYKSVSFCCEMERDGVSTIVLLGEKSNTPLVICFYEE